MIFLASTLLPRRVWDWAMRKVGNLNAKSIDFDASRRATTPATESAPLPVGEAAEVRARTSAHLASGSARRRVAPCPRAAVLPLVAPGMVPARYRGCSVTSCQRDHAPSASDSDIEIAKRESGKPIRRCWSRRRAGDRLPGAASPRCRPCFDGDIATTFARGAAPDSPTSRTVKRDHRLHRGAPRPSFRS